MSTTYVNTINSTPIFADRATKDASGNDIQSTYAHDSALSSYALSANVSAYQVVSATATQLYASTSFLTSVNGAPVSASRAGQAANASLANSAYYDGTGRLISALPDSAAVSSIASGYVTGVSATVANNSASWGGGGGSVVSPSGTIFVTNGNEVEGTNSAVALSQTSTGVTSLMQKAYGVNAIGTTGMTELSYSDPGESGMNLVFTLAGEYHGADATVVLSGRDREWNFASASGLIVERDTIGKIPLGTIRAQVSASSDNWVNLYVGDNYFSAVKAPGYAVTGVGELAWNSALTGVSSTVANNSASWGQGGVITATGSGIVSGTGISSLNGSSIIAQSLSNSGRIMIGQAGDPGMYLTGTHGTAYYKANEMIINRSGYGEQVKFNLGSAGSQVYGSATGTRGAFIQMNNDSHTAMLGAKSGEDAVISLDGYSANSASMSAWDDVVDTVSANSASWGQGGVDSATVSSIASSYAQDVSAAVSGTVDTVSSQSANWGGSALALSAGPGVTLTKSGSTLIAGLDETVLWSGNSFVTANETLTASDILNHYKYLQIWGCAWPETGTQEGYYERLYCTMATTGVFGTANTWRGSFCIDGYGGGGSAMSLCQVSMSGYLSGTTLSVFSSVNFRFNGATLVVQTAPAAITKIVGVNRVG